MNMQWQEAMADYFAWLRAGHASPGTIRLRRNYLRRFAAGVEGGPWDATTADMVAYLGRNGWSPETRKSARATLRSFYRWALEDGRVSTDPAHRLPAIRIPQVDPRPCPEPVLRVALAGAGPRELAMILLGGFAGLRRAEIAQLHTRDVVGDEARVHGKGGRVRVVPLHPLVSAALEALHADGYYFPGKINGHLSPDRVGKLLRLQLGSTWSGHTLRHRFASEAYAIERDLRAIQQLLGHSKPETTARYTKVPDHARRAAVMGLGIK